MLRVTLKGLRGHLVRLLLTAFSVTLGVSLISGTYVLRALADDGALLGGDDVTVTVTGTPRTPPER